MESERSKLNKGAYAAFVAHEWKIINKTRSNRIEQAEFISISKDIAKKWNLLSIDEKIKFCDSQLISDLSAVQIEEPVNVPASTEHTNVDNVEEINSNEVEKSDTEPKCEDEQIDEIKTEDPSFSDIAQTVEKESDIEKEDETIDSQPENEDTQIENPETKVSEILNTGFLLPNSNTSDTNTKKASNQPSIHANTWQERLLGEPSLTDIANAVIRNKSDINQSDSRVSDEQQTVTEPNDTNTKKPLNQPSIHANAWQQRLLGEPSLTDIAQAVIRNKSDIDQLDSRQSDEQPTPDTVTFLS